MSRVQQLPSAEILDARLEEQRRRIFQAQGIIGTAARAAHSASVGQLGDADRTQFTSDLWLALEHIHDLLERVAGRLDPVVLLEVAEEEDVQS